MTRIEGSLRGALTTARDARRTRDDIVDAERAMIARHKAAEQEDTRTGRLLMAARKAIDKANSQENRRAAHGKTLGGPLAHVDPILQADEEVVMTAVQRDGAALMHAHPSLAGNKNIVMAAVQNKGESIRFASEDLRRDKEVVLAALTSGRVASQRTPSSAERPTKRQASAGDSVPPLPLAPPLPVSQSTAPVCLTATIKALCQERMEIYLLSETKPYSAGHIDELLLNWMSMDASDENKATVRAAMRDAYTVTKQFKISKYKERVRTTVNAYTRVHEGVVCAITVAHRFRPS